MAGQMNLEEYGRLHREVARLLALWRYAGAEEALEAEIEARISGLFLSRRRLAAALQPLPASRREPLIRRYLYGQTAEEIAEEMADGSVSCAHGVNS